MSYPEKHLLLTIHWRHSSWPLEMGQVGIRFHVTGAGNLDATQAKVDACKPAVQTFWTALGAKIPSLYGLDFLRLARIDETGRYVAGSSSFDARYGASTLSGGGTLPVTPMQTACVTTLMAGVPHGQASKGRIYLPPIAATPGQDGLWTASDCNSRSSNLATMLTSLNTALNGNAAIYSSGTQRSSDGLARAVKSVATGTRPDVQRRRAKGVPDVRGTASAVVLGGDTGEVYGAGLLP